MLHAPHPTELWCAQKQHDQRTAQHSYTGCLREERPPVGFLNARKGVIPWPLVTFNTAGLLDRISPSPNEGINCHTPSVCLYKEARSRYGGPHTPHRDTRLQLTLRVEGIYMEKIRQHRRGSSRSCPCTPPLGGHCAVAARLVEIGRDPLRVTNNPLANRKKHPRNIHRGFGLKKSPLSHTNID